MANKRHNKFKRKEKSKVKLKTTKTDLTKAKNITDTTFKVRKIVVPEQLKKKDDTEIVTRKKLNVKELLTRLKHHNVSMKRSSLEGIKELLTEYHEEDLGLYLMRLVEGVSHLILDEDKNVRRDAIKVIGVILEKVPLTKLSPFFNIFLSYLRCGMTHIHISIQDDSLMMLDTLLASAPLLVAGSSHKILTNFLDMISSQKVQSGPNRTLTVQLGTKFTAVKWRIKVLQRLHDLLSTILSHRRDEAKRNEGCSMFCQCLENNKIQHWTSDFKINIPVHVQHYRKVCHLPSIFGSAYKGDDSFDDGNHLTNYAKVVLPLLIETWLEVGPNSNESSEENESLLTSDAVSLLTCVLKIIIILFEILELLKIKSQVPRVTAAYKKSFLQYIFPGFPYSSHDNVKRTKSEKLHENVRQDKTCQDHNLAICMLFCYFCDEDVNTQYCVHVLSYIKHSLLDWKALQDRKALTEALRYALIKNSKCWFQEGVEMGYLINQVVKCFQKTSDESLLELLCELSLLDHSRQLDLKKSLVTWLESLAVLLTLPTISIKVLKMLMALATRNDPHFYSSLCRNLPDILNNLGNISVTGVNKAEGIKSLVFLLYWVKDWSPDALQILSMHIQCEHWDKEIMSEIMHMLAARELTKPSLDASEDQ